MCQTRSFWANIISYVFRENIPHGSFQLFLDCNNGWKCFVGLPLVFGCSPLTLRNFSLLSTDASFFLSYDVRECHEGKYAISRENLANKSLRNCDVRQVLCILTIFCRFKPKNVCILPTFSSFQSFQSKIILVKCCKEVIVPPE